MAIFAKSLDLEITAGAMSSLDYKRRFVAEYVQTKVRYERLKAFTNKIEVDELTKYPESPKRIIGPKHDCPLHLLRDQQRAMGEYLHILEVRAVIEEIDLESELRLMIEDYTLSAEQCDTCDTDG